MRRPKELIDGQDTRTLSLFRADMFVRPPTDGGPPVSILSQTAYAIDVDGGAALSYEVVQLQPSPASGYDDSVGLESPLRDVLVRCVSTYVP